MSMTTTTTLERPRPATPAAAAAKCCGRHSFDSGPDSGPAWPVAALLRELAGVVERLGDDEYMRKPVGVIPGSVGGHVRHCLDHATALPAAVSTGHLDYDR